MAIIHDLDKTMKYHIDEFYGNASVYRSNKYLFGMFGDYVKLAVEKMEKGANEPNKLIFDSKVYKDALDNWKSTFYSPFYNPATHKNEHEVSMKWACAGVSIPHTSSDISNDKISYN
jgi:hypothetical protein